MKCTFQNGWKVNVMYILPQFLTSAQGKHVTSVTKWWHDSSKKTTFPLGFTGETEPTGYMDPQKKIHCQDWAQSTED